jgi:Cof subfamily protein (haloacid dehalogenase superfamily)
MLVVLLGVLSCSSSSSVVAFIAPSKPSSSSILLLSAAATDNDDNAADDDDIRNILGRPIPSNPFAQDVNRPNKSDLYQSDELSVLWELHQDLSAMQPPTPPITSQTINESNVRDLHDIVLQMLGDSEEETQESSSSDWLDDAAKARIGQVRAIASDVDGTLLTTQQTMHPRTKQAVQDALSRTFSPLDQLQYFFPATGKSRAGAMKSVGPDVAKLLSQVPGVFLQGLYCVDGQGEVVFQRKLNILQVEAVEALAKEVGVSIIAYDGDQLWTTEVTEAVKTLHEQFSEPMPELLGTPIAKYGPSVNKIILIDLDVDKLRNIVRPQLEALAEEYDATVTSAMPTMLEWLPSGCSKALGVEKLCEKLGINPSTQLLAMGDAENDVEMLKMASIGVAMGNASPIASEAADYVMTETNDEGGAGAAMEIFGFGLY